jgi:hypothetical protein
MENINLKSAKRLETIERKRKEKYNREHKIIDGIDYKLCNKHHIYFPEEDIWQPSTLEYFYYNEKNSTDFLHPCCKRCSSIKSRQNQLDNPERTKQYLADWHIKHRDFVINRLVNWRNDHHDHKREYEKEYYIKYPEKYILYNQNHRDHDITEEEWKKCLEVFDYKCAYCGLPQEKHIVIRNGKYIIMNLHKEHVDNEGYNDLRNGVPACKSCNDRKHIKDIEDWYKKQEFFTEERYNKIIWWITEGYKDYIEDKPPYRIIREKNKDNNKYHFNLWSVDEKRNTLEIIATKDKKKDLQNDIKKYLETILVWI